MARIRTLKPEMWMSPQVMNLSHGARLLFIGLITQADDEGRGVADPRKLKAAIFGGDDITSADVRRMLDECSTQRLAAIYEDASHGMLYELPSWKSHQSIDRPKKSAYPSASEARKPEIVRRTLVEPHTINREGSDLNGSEWNGGEGKGSYPCARETELDQRPDSDYADAFAALKLAYPKFAGRQDWPNAEHHWRMRIEQGVSIADLDDAVKRYARFVEAGGVSGPQYVLTPGKFFAGADKPWAQPWDPPATKSETRLAGNISAAEEFMRRTEAVS